MHVHHILLLLFNSSLVHCFNMMVMMLVFNVFLIKRHTGSRTDKMPFDCKFLDFKTGSDRLIFFLLDSQLFINLIIIACLIFGLPIAQINWIKGLHWVHQITDYQTMMMILIECMLSSPVDNGTQKSPTFGDIRT